MNSEGFWLLVEATRAETKERQLEKFKSELQCLTAEQLIEFERQFIQFKFAAYNWDLWLVAWLCQGGMCSDDSFSDFRSWLISRGRAVYELALVDADALVDEMRQADDPRFELFGYVAGKVYRELTEEDFPDFELQHPTEPAGGDWLRPELKDQTGSRILNRCVVFNKMDESQYAKIRERFPRIWTLCVEKGIMTNEGPKKSEWPSNLPTIEQIAATIDPNLAKTDINAYLKAVTDAARQAYKKKD